MTAILKVDEIQDTAGNLIIKEDSNTITVGASGDTITIPSGATINVAGTLNKGGVAVANTPTFHAYRSSTLSVPNTTQTLVTFDTEAFDSASAYDTSTGKFTPQVAGKYVVYTQVTPNSASDFDVFEAQLYKNAVTTAGTQALCRGRNEAHETKYINRIVEFNGSTDFVYVYVYQNSGSSVDVRGTKYDTFFGAYKIIE